MELINKAEDFHSAEKTDFSRFDLRMNSDIEVIKDLNVRFDVSFSDIDRSLFDNGISGNITDGTATSPSFLALAKAPFLSPYAIDIRGNVSSYLAEADDYLSSEFGTIYQLRFNDITLANPTAILEYGEGDNRNSLGNRLVSFSVNPKYKINKYLSVEEAFNFSLVNTNEDYYLPISGVPTFTMLDWSLDGGWGVAHNVRQSMTSRQNTVQSDTRMKWENAYGANAIKLTAGMRYINSKYRYNFQKGYNTGNDKTPNMSTGLAYKSKNGADDKFIDFTNYLVADYNYAQKIYVTAGLSAMASSRFGKDAVGLKALGTVWGVFPSVQASYVISNENWLAKVNGIDYLRFNGGFDITGNDDVDYTASRTYFIAKTMLREEVNTKSLGNVGNSNLKW